MSEIDIERLKVDADYWLESDPSDGEATHYEACYSDHECAWVRVDRRGKRHYFRNGGWTCAEGAGYEIGPVESMIPRPTKQEWEGGLPEDGDLVVVSDDEANPGVYFLCEFQAEGPRFQEHPKGGCFYPDEISSWNSTGIRIKSPHERQREEVIEAVRQVIREAPEDKSLLHALYDAGMLRKGDKP